MFMDIHLLPDQRTYKYSKETLMPYLFYFKYIARRPSDEEESQKIRS